MATLQRIKKLMVKEWTKKDILGQTVKNGNRPIGFRHQTSLELFGKFYRKFWKKKKIRNLMNISCEYISIRTLASSTEYFKND